MTISQIGNISYFSHNIIVWEIPNFSFLPKEKDDFLCSPLFFFSPKESNKKLKNYIYQFEPIGGHIGVILSSEQSQDICSNTCFKFSVVSKNNEEIGSCDSEWFKEENNPGYFRTRSLVKSENLKDTTKPIQVFIKVNDKNDIILENRNGHEDLIGVQNLESSDRIFMFDILKSNSEEIRSCNGESTKEEILVAKNNVEDIDELDGVFTGESSKHVILPKIKNGPEDLSNAQIQDELDENFMLHTENSNNEERIEKEDDPCYFMGRSNVESTDKPVAVFTEKCNMHDIDLEKAKSLEAHNQDFEELFRTGMYSDLTIKVKGHKFKVHKTILRTRSKRFVTMLLNDPNTIVIKNYNPKAFETFLLFIYTGKTHCLFPNHLCELYRAAHEYEVLGLKQICIQYLKSFLSIEIFCDAFLLIIKYKEYELLNHIVKFFANNMKEIIRTKKFPFIMKRHPYEVQNLLSNGLENKN